jgi:hypothetical protein
VAEEVVAVQGEEVAARQPPVVAVEVLAAVEEGAAHTADDP